MIDCKPGGFERTSVAHVPVAVMLRYHHGSLPDEVGDLLERHMKSCAACCQQAADVFANGGTDLEPEEVN